MGYTGSGRNAAYINQGPDFDDLNGYSARPISRYRLERESDRARFGGGRNNAVNGNVLSLLAPFITSAPRAEATPARVTGHLGVAQPDRGWGAANNPEGQKFREHAKQEAAQAEKVAASQAAVPLVAKGFGKPPSGQVGGRTSNGAFGGGAPPAGKPGAGRPSGAFGTSATPPPGGSPTTLLKPAPVAGTPRVKATPPSTFAPQATPPLATPRRALSTPRAFSPEAPSTPPLLPKATPMVKTTPAPTARPLTTPPPMVATPKPTPPPRLEHPSGPAGPATPHASKPPLKTFDPIATPRPRTNPTGDPGPAAMTPRPFTPPNPTRSTPFIAPRTTVPTAEPTSRPHTATGGGGVPVIPNATPRKLPPGEPMGGGDPRKGGPSLKPGGNPNANPRVGPTPSPTPKRP